MEDPRKTELPLASYPQYDSQLHVDAWCIILVRDLQYH